MINRILVANRGEIARRVFRTCRDLGISTVAIHSDADATMPFVGEADVAVRLPGNTPAETYLRGDLVIAAAQRAGADAIHPGYGFLSENAEFARSVIEAGLTWVGPDPASMEKMATKVEAKALMAAAGVPVLTELKPGDVTEADLPILVKASSGGGGRGMRVVRTLSEVAGAVELASAEAASAFGDPTVFCEPYVENGRHVEVQLVGDRHGNVEVFGERDCSVQRRHQKVIEETPAPGLSEDTRAALHEAARQAGKAIAYVGAGTVEFLLSGDRFFFLEMNTRLQVEHPVTELVTGTDLVALQLAVAEGGSSYAASAGAHSQGDDPVGHAVEVRLYAEDPAAGYQPQSGRLRRFVVPGVRAEFENPTAFGIRLDSGVRAGDEIGTFYDAMIAKVIAWAPTRDQALRQLAGALERAEIHGLRTNRDLLVNLLRDPVVVAGDIHTTYLDSADLGVLTCPPGGPDSLELAGFAAAVALAERARLASPHHARIPAGWRNVTSQPQLTSFVTDEGVDYDVRWYGGREFRSADLDGVVVERVETGEQTTTVTLGGDGMSRRFVVHIDGDAVDVESPIGHVALTKQPRFMDPSDVVASGSLLAPMPGSVVTVAVAAGDTVEAGQQILVLEAMKMQHSVTAPHNGVVAEIDVKPGDQVAAGAVLAVVSEDESADETVEEQ